ncbi:peroxiredoxin [Chitinophaga rhizophila]|uniref:thioredoxin-dependent peroxiredoxin n=1 Tax=Chitinophaga rhizophila TaxID=2866212 RepID=A0ABS7GIT2_9BACT|nr:peroxiredoxin [Chitinophaga rhizophila]MBW8687611.1 peroxiredoxin [Chitinophaga rhizophila]
MILFGKAQAQLKAGDKAPVFTLQDQDGQTFDISTVIGKHPIVIFFYPKDETSVCTKEACSFRDAYEDFTKLGAKVIGISGDNVASHRSFADHHRLPYTLLADEGNKVRKLFGVPKKVFIPGRVTYVVDKQGVITYVFNNMTDGPKHVTEALKAVEGMTK